MVGLLGDARSPPRLTPRKMVGVPSVTVVASESAVSLTRTVDRKASDFPRQRASRNDGELAIVRFQVKLIGDASHSIKTWSRILDTNQV